MKRKLSQICLVFYCILMYSNTGLSQQKIKLHDSIAYKASQFSAMAVTNEKIFLVTERCEKIFVFTNDGNYKKVQDILLDTGLNKIYGNTRPATEMEAAALYKNYLLISDEKNACLYSYNLNNGVMNKVKFRDNKSPIINDTNKWGNEGLAINSDKNICYLVKEKVQDPNTNASLIRSFSFEVTDDLFTFTHLSDKDLKINHPYGWRYSDAFFEGNYLYLFKSYKHDDNLKYNHYSIDTIAVNRGGYFTTNLVVDSRKIEAEIVETKTSLRGYLNEFNKPNSEYNPNIEALSIHNNKIYLVSDNCQGCENNKWGEQEKLKTLFIVYGKKK